jgi:hypothetical protein
MSKITEAPRTYMAGEEQYVGLLLSDADRQPAAAAQDRVRRTTRVRSAARRPAQPRQSVQSLNPPRSSLS